MNTLAALRGSMLLSLVLPGTLMPAFAAEPIKIPMTAGRWDVKDNVTFETDATYPLGVMTVTKGVAVLKDLKFSNGTIEFDVIPRGPMGAGIGFRLRDDDTYEDFYLRPRPKCDAAVDCIQYAPQTHGVLPWDVFPRYQSPAPVEEKGVNHIKMVISGQRMNIYVNPQANGGMITPTLAIGRLEGDTLEGGILMQGPGTFANLTVTPDAVEGLSPEPIKDATDADDSSCATGSWPRRVLCLRAKNRPLPRCRRHRRDGRQSRRSEAGSSTFWAS